MQRVLANSRYSFFRWNIRQFFVLVITLSVLAVIVGYRLKPRFQELRQERLHKMLISAAMEGDLRQVRRAIAAGAIVDYRPLSFEPNAVDLSALHYAVIHGQEHVVRELLASGADVDGGVLHRGGVTPLTMAVSEGDQSLVKILLNACADPNLGHSLPLHSAVRNGDVPMIRLLLKGGAFDFPGRYSSLMVLIDSRLPDQKRLEIGRLLLEHGALARGLPAARIEPTDPVTHSPMRLAIQKSDTVMIDLFTEYTDLTPFEAVVLDRIDQVQQMVQEDPSLLTKRYYDRSSPAYGISLLGMALQRGHRELAVDLIKAGAPVDALTVEPAETMLHLAVRGGDPELVRLMIDQGIDVNARSSSSREDLTPVPTGWWSLEEQTPLHFAARLDHVEAAQILLESEADITARDRNGWTPLALAAALGSVGVAQLLLQHDHDPASRAEALRVARRDVRGYLEAGIQEVKD